MNPASDLKLRFVIALRLSAKIFFADIIPLVIVMFASGKTDLHFAPAVF